MPEYRLLILVHIKQSCVRDSMSSGHQSSSRLVPDLTISLGARYRANRVANHQQTTTATISSLSLSLVYMKISLGIGHVILKTIDRPVENGKVAFRQAVSQADRTNESWFSFSN